MNTRNVRVTVQPSPTYGLLQSIANIAVWMGYFQYSPEDSRCLTEDSISWAREFEALFAERLAAGQCHEDDYIEDVDVFAMTKLREVQEQCLRPLVWPVHALEGTTPASAVMPAT